MRWASHVPRPASSPASAWPTGGWCPMRPSPWRGMPPGAPPGAMPGVRATPALAEAAALDRCRGSLNGLQAECRILLRNLRCWWRPVPPRPPCPGAGQPRPLPLEPAAPAAGSAGGEGRGDLGAWLCRAGPRPAERDGARLRLHPQRCRLGRAALRPQSRRGCALHQPAAAGGGPGGGPGGRVPAASCWAGSRGAGGRPSWRRAPGRSWWMR